jgi:hypothetical protein
MIYNLRLAVDDLISLDEAVRWSGLHLNTLRRLLRQGVIEGRKARIGEARVRWWVSRRSLRQYMDPDTGFLLDRRGPRLYLRRRDEDRAP